MPGGIRGSRATGCYQKLLGLAPPQHDRTTSNTGNVVGPESANFGHSTPKAQIGHLETALWQADRVGQGAAPGRHGPSIDIVVRQSGTWAPTKSRRAGLSAANPELVAYPADLCVHELDCDHILGRPDNPERGVGMGVKNFGAVAAAFAGRDITVIPRYIQGQPALRGRFSMSKFV